MLSYVLATRPWSFTVPVMGTLLVSALLHTHEGLPLLNRGCLETMLLCVLLQGAGERDSSFPSLCMHGF